MNRSALIGQNSHADAIEISRLVHLAMLRGLLIGRPVKIGTVRGIIIGYNIAQRGSYPGTRYPLLVKTELGTAKFGLDEVMPA
jgi:hypothetical protein